MPTSPRPRRLLTALLVAAAVPLAAPGLARAAVPHDRPDGPPPQRVAHAHEPVAVTTTAGATWLRADAVQVAVGAR